MSIEFKDTLFIEGFRRIILEKRRGGSFLLREVLN